MEQQDDPEARVNALEGQLADAARGTELGAGGEAKAPFTGNSPAAPWAPAPMPGAPLFGWTSGQPDGWAEPSRAGSVSGRRPCILRLSLILLPC